LCFTDTADDFEWVKGRADLTEAANVKVDRNTLDIQPIELKDVDVYTCIAKKRPIGGGDFSVNSSSVAFDYNFMVHKINHGLSRAPEIIEIYKHGEQKYNHEYAVKCQSGIFRTL
jgi:hypothetical protein